MRTSRTRAAEIGKQSGLWFVYAGNRPDAHPMGARLSSIDFSVPGGRYVIGISGSSAAASGEMLPSSSLVPPWA